MDEFRPSRPGKYCLDGISAPLQLFRVGRGLLPRFPRSADVSQLAQAFEGIGALSGGGGVTRLLIDYSEALQQDIYDILFTPKAGASLQISTLQAPSGSPSLRSSRSLPTRTTRSAHS